MPVTTPPAALNAASIDILTKQMMQDAFAILNVQNAIRETAGRFHPRFDKKTARLKLMKGVRISQPSVFDPNQALVVGNERGSLCFRHGSFGFSRS